MDWDLGETKQYEGQEDALQEIFQRVLVTPA
jgi:hypothetical protein